MNIESFDLRAYLNFLNVPFSEAGKNVSYGWLGTQCIYCTDNYNHLGIHLILKYFSCWKCKETGSLITLIGDLENVGYSTALHRIDEFQSPIPVEPEEDDRERIEDVGQDILPYGCYPGKLTIGQDKYLRSRKFNPETLIKTWGIQAGPNLGPWRYRIIIPVELKKRVVTWIGLDASGHQQIKYKAAAVTESFIPASELLYGMDRVGKNVLVVEGVTDVWRMGSGAVATFGMGVTLDKLEQLLYLGSSKYFIMFDGEPQALKNAKTMAHHLSNRGKKVEVLSLGQGDPADMSGQEVEDLRMEIGLDE